MRLVSKIDWWLYFESLFLIKQSGNPTNMGAVCCGHFIYFGYYPQFLNQHGGFANAYTSLEHTNFYFDVSHEHLGGALDR